MLLLFTALACSPSADDTSEGPTDTAPRSVERIVLHEAFSGSNCGPCEPAARNLSNALQDADGRYAMVKYQIGSDPYISAEAVGRRMMYLPGESSYGIPYVHADGTNAFHPNEMDDGEPYDASDFELLAQVEASLAVDVTMALEGQTVSSLVTIDPIHDLESSDLRLMVAIIENKTTENIGSNGQTEFHNVFKKFVPDSEGTPLDALTADESVSFDLTYEFQGEYADDTAIDNQVDHATEHTVEEFEDLAVIAWVQDATSWTVYNTGFDGIH
jgi:hypothetical protein